MVVHGYNYVTKIVVRGPHLVVSLYLPLQQALQTASNSVSDSSIWMVPTETFALRIQICPRKGNSPTVYKIIYPMTWGWD